MRSHLQVLERDGLVRASGTRRAVGVGKPARLYQVDPEAEQRFSRAYAPLLRALVDAVAEREGSAPVEQLLRQAGRRLGHEVAQPAAGPGQQALVAADILTELGAVVEVEEHKGRYLIRGSGCPVSVASAVQPAVCCGVEALLAEATGAEVRECCARNGRPQCRFELGSSASLAG